MSSTYLRKDGRWETRISLGVIDGKRRFKSFYGETKEEAEGNMMKANGSYSSGILTKMTVRELCIEWLKVCEFRVKISTLANYRMKIDKHILPYFGNMSCGMITSKEAYRFMSEKLDAGLSPRYVSDIMVLLKSVFKYAQREYGIISPFENIIMPKCVKPKVRLLDQAEQARLIHHLRDHINSYTLAIILALSMGLRIGEVCGLMWKDIDFEKRTLTVSRTVQRVAVKNKRCKTKVMILPPKSQTSVREIPIPTDVFAVLIKKRGESDHFIISGSDEPTEPRKLQYHFKKILNNAELPSVHFHSLRHAMASSAIALGFDIKTLSEILGHSRIELTMNLYVHSDLDRKRRYMDKIKLVV